MSSPKNHRVSHEFLSSSVNSMGNIYRYTHIYVLASLWAKISEYALYIMYIYTRKNTRAYIYIHVYIPNFQQLHAHVFFHSLTYCAMQPTPDSSCAHLALWLVYIYGRICRILLFLDCLLLYLWEKISYIFLISYIFDNKGNKNEREGIATICLEMNMSNY